MRTLSTRFTEAYGVRHPVAQAGMAFAGMTPELALAVCEAGGLGSLAVGRMPPPALPPLVAAIRAGTAQPFNVNFITIYTEQEHVDTVCELGVAVASFHWGHPDRAWIDQLHAAGTRVWEQVGDVAAAVRAVEDGVDLVVVQGSEAGGHNYGSLPLSALVPAVVDAVAPHLVLAAGGISDGRGLAAALVLGADGAWVGTRFVATHESSAADDYKARLVAAAGTDTVRTSLFGPEDPDFNPMRVLRTRLVAAWTGREDAAPTESAGQPVIGTMDLLGQQVPLHRFSNLVPMRGATGDLDEMPLLSGQGVGLVRDVLPAADVVTRMVDEAAAALARYAPVPGTAV